MHDGTQIDFEMQVAEFDFWKKRIVFYLSKMVTDQIHKGDDYDKIQKCIHVSILDFVHFPEDNRYYRKLHLRYKNGRDLYKISWRFMCWNWGSYHRKIRTKKES